MKEPCCDVDKSYKKKSRFDEKDGWSKEAAEPYNQKKRLRCMQELPGHKG